MVVFDRSVLGVADGFVEVGDAALGVKVQGRSALFTDLVLRSLDHRAANTLSAKFLPHRHAA